MPVIRGFFFFLIGLLTIAAGCSGSRPHAISPEDAPDPFSREAFNFMVMGDWGRNGLFDQDDVARQMGVTGDSISSRFVISTGDNFYPDGVESIEDLQWARSYETIYTAPVLHRPWYVVLGNHDWQGNVDAQLLYHAISDRWTMPSRYYSAEFPISDSTRALFLFLDTTELADAERARLYPQSDRWDQSRQLHWADSTLGASTAQWKIVIGHHPIYMASSRYEDNPHLIANLLPILERHGVQAYFAGHDHNLQHLRREGSPIHYFISGAGSLTRGVDRDDPDALFLLQSAGFMAVSMTDEVM
ncbi:MAG: tartrate-resistant acid phosphatase type 5 family protein, partial [Rubricoccaceae bacterium]|nr:tartrate-resistant acid phosphatase type 5 family protein [Rubricoccaceae bacterium]